MTNNIVSLKLQKIKRGFFDLAEVRRSSSHFSELWNHFRETSANSENPTRTN